MPTARELLQEIDALMRRNRASVDGGADAPGAGIAGPTGEHGKDGAHTASARPQDHLGSVDAGPPTEALPDRQAHGSSTRDVQGEPSRPAVGGDDPPPGIAVDDGAAVAGNFDGIPVLTDRAPAVPAGLDEAIPVLNAVVPDDLPVLTEAVDAALAEQWLAAQAAMQRASGTPVGVDPGGALTALAAAGPVLGEESSRAPSSLAVLASEPDAMLAEAAAQVPLATGVAAIDPTALDGFVEAYEGSAPLHATHEPGAAADTSTPVAREENGNESQVEDEIAVEAALAASAHAAAASFGSHGFAGDFAVASRSDEPPVAAGDEAPAYSQADAEAEIEALIAAETLAAESAAMQAVRVLPPLPPRAAVPTEAAETIAAPLSAADDARWSAMAEEIRMQVLQRVDLFTESGLTAELAQKLQPIVAEAGAQLVATINREVGALLRAYIAETIEREIEQWRNKGES